MVVFGGISFACETLINEISHPEGCGKIRDEISALIDREQSFEEMLDNLAGVTADSNITNLTDEMMNAVRLGDISAYREAAEEFNKACNYS